LHNELLHKGGEQGGKRVIDQHLKTVRGAVVFNPEVQVAPACILWPDRDRQWESVIPLLQPKLSVFLGGYHNIFPSLHCAKVIWDRNYPGTIYLSVKYLQQPEEDR
jgi:hypothetical protein